MFASELSYERVWAAIHACLSLSTRPRCCVTQLHQFPAVHRQVLKAQKIQQAHRKPQDDKPQGAVKKPGMPSTHAARMQQLAQCTDVRQPRPISDEDTAAGAHAFPAEDDEGNVEYKLRLKEPNCSPVRFQQLVGGTCTHSCSGSSVNVPKCIGSLHRAGPMPCIRIGQCADDYHMSLHRVPHRAMQHCLETVSGRMCSLRHQNVSISWCSGDSDEVQAGGGQWRVLLLHW